MSEWDESSFTDILTDIAERVSANREELSERDVETIFFDEAFFAELGFDSPGVDVQQERTLADGTRPDVITTRDSSSVRAVYEFKEPTKALGDFTAQLEDYVAELDADAGVLTNGLELWLYDGESESFHRTTTLALFSAAEPENESDVADLRDALEKDEWAYTRQGDLDEYLAETADSPLNLDTEIAQTFFFDTFRFDRHGAFSELIDAGMDLLDGLREADAEFVTGSFEFWQRSYARLPDDEDVPRAWKRFVEVDGEVDEDRLADFMFTLESGFALLSRLFLTKAADDYEFFVDDPVRDRLETLGGRNGEIEPPSYVRVVTELFEDLRAELIESLFEDDIFQWWTDGFRDVRAGPGQSRFAGLSAAGTDVPTAIEGPRDRFATAVAKLLLSVLKFDFSQVNNVDLLGGLYQNYFDEDTRKALGEFYTPAGVVELILDRVEYASGNGIADKRLVDPACGSGTFLSDAIDRYLDDVKRQANGNPDWQDALETLCLEPRIVGFDVHPFAVLMAQISFTLSILDPYKQAKVEDESFTIRRLPIFRTDTLHKESHDPGADLAGEGQRTLFDAGGEANDATIPLELPLAVEDPESEDDETTQFLQTTITLPRYDVLRDVDRPGTGVDTYGDYFRVLLAVLDVVKAHVAADESTYSPVRADLSKAVGSYLDGPIGGLESKLEPYVEGLLDVVSELEQQEGGGRLLPIFEDVALSLIVKNYLSYDYVVANPPYVEANNIDSETKDDLESMYPETTTGKYDLYCPFYERGVDWLTEGGRLGYITPNQFMVTAYGEGVRSYLTEKTEIQELYDFRDSGVFADATNYPVVVVAEKDDVASDAEIHSVRVKRVDEDAAAEDEQTEPEGPQFGALRAQVPQEDDDEPTTIDTSLDERVLSSIRRTFDADEYSDPFIDAFSFPQAGLRDDYWSPMPADEWDVFTQIEERADTSLSGFLDLHAGTQTGANDVYVVTPTNVDRVDWEETGGTVEAVPKGGGAPVTLERDLLRPWLRGSDVERWRPDWSGEHVIFPYKTVQGNGGSESVPLDPEEMRELEHTWSYLTRDDVKETLEEREGGSMRGKKHWYKFTAPKSHIDLSKPKVIAAETASDARFATDEEGSWFFKSAYGAPFPPELRDRRKYLAAYLNSRVFDFYLKHVSSLKSGGHYKYTTNYVGRVPAITELSDPVRETVEEAVETLLTHVDTKQKIERFPESYLGRASGEIRTLEQTWSSSFSPIEAVEYEYGHSMEYQVNVGDGAAVLTQQAITENGEEMAEFVVEALRHRSVAEGETSRIPYPVESDERSRLLAAFRDDKRDVEAFDRDEVEAALDETILQQFMLDDDQRETIESFLDAYSER